MAKTKTDTPVEATPNEPGDPALAFGGPGGFTPAGEDGPTFGLLPGVSETEIGDRAAAYWEVEQERGYRGWNPDPTPNEAYTVTGVVSNPDALTGPRPVENSLQQVGSHQPQPETPHGAGPVAISEEA